MLRSQTRRGLICGAGAVLLARGARGPAASAQEQTLPAYSIKSIGCKLDHSLVRNDVSNQQVLDADSAKTTC